MVHELCAQYPSLHCPVPDSLGHPGSALLRAKFNTKQSACLLLYPASRLSSPLSARQRVDLVFYSSVVWLWKFFLASTSEWGGKRVTFGKRSSMQVMFSGSVDGEG